MEKFLELMTEALERDTGTVQADDVFREYPEWDSLAHLTVISLIDEEYGMVIPRDEFGKMQTLAEVYQYISSNSQQL
ncbi:MAG: acyl carrier protein [Candidatus Cloacimonetes bacterium]|nr:acyl carrier protein [Candidatus Cloacimonadota bacterium]